MAHILIVGGTGMLRQATLHFAQAGTTVSVVARSQSSLDALVQEAKAAGGHINPLALDYRNSDVLRTELQRAIEEHGPITTAICWIHSIAPEAPHIIAAEMGGQGSACSYFRVFGSAYAKTLRAFSAEESPFAEWPQIAYRVVVLGGVHEAGGFRWLTHDEISAGVVQAVEGDIQSFVVGDLP